MAAVSVEEKLIKVSSNNGINIYHINAGKFKTNTINVFFHDNLSADTAAMNALLPAVLRRGCKNQSTLQDIALFLEGQYGAIFDCGVVKKGERQIMQFYLEYVADKFTGQETRLFENCFGLLFDILTAPVLDNGVFREDYTSQEKENLRKLIEGRINDKASYAVDRCFEEMCRNEPFGVYEYGRVENLQQIDPNSLYSHYLKFMKEFPVDVFLTGSFEEDEIKKVAERFSSLKRGNIKELRPAQTSRKVEHIREITEKLEVNQGKLTLGYRTNTAPNEGDYYTLLVYNSILGGGVQSKLFQNVREKASLAYYVYSRLEKFKGLMVVSSGIDTESKEKAVEIIKAQFNEINSGNISDYEFDSTIRYIENGIRSLKDSQLQIVDFYLSQVVSGSSDDFDGLLEKVRQVERQQVSALVNRINLDTVYFLTNRE